VARADEEREFGASVVIIELTDNDIEIQVFVDGEWAQLKVLDPKERKIFDARTAGRLRRQTGISEMFFASEPTHYLEDEPEFDGFMGPGPVEIIEYQVILDEVDPEREMAWVDGHTRRALINLPGTVTSLTVPPEFLVPGTSYEFEILAIEASGNSSISVGEFDVRD